MGCTSNVIVIHLCMFSDRCAHPKGRFNFLRNATVLLIQRDCGMEFTGQNDKELRKARCFESSTEP